MSESATAESAYFHTLIFRPYFFPTGPRDKRLSDVISRLTELPAEIRWKIFEHAFQGNRVAVTAKSGCYCSSEATGPYRADHEWLLKSCPPGKLRREAKRVFVRTAMWEVHCQQAMDSFVSRMTALGCLDDVHHVRWNVYELEADWKLDLEMFSKLRTATFAPWQKGWTIDIPGQTGSEQLSDENVMLKVWHVVDSKEGYGPVRKSFEEKRTRGYQMYFVFPIRFHLPPSQTHLHPSRSQPRWQLCVWRANLDTGIIERSWREVHLVQEATLD